MRLTRGDCLLLAVLSLLTLVLWLALNSGLTGVAEVVVAVEGDMLGIFPLDQDRTINVTGSRGPAVVEIAGGRVRIASSDCPDHSWHSHWLSTRGSLVCVPNRVVVEVRAGAGEDGLDAITR
ncbi:MAG: NusG domain II-containing protein [bacterium]|nr:NusG domain II-containing protein [bacterium]